MFLINAILLQGRWRSQFDPDLTTDDEFAGPDGTPEALQNDAAA